MRMIQLVCIALLIPCLGISQIINKVITKSETERIERVLASDEMEGRRTFTPSIDKAAAFIAKEFEATGLKSMKGDNNFLQSFSINRPKFISLSATIDGSVIDTKQVIVVTIEPEIKSGSIKNDWCKSKNDCASRRVACTKLWKTSSF
jgi:hypothetical protein